MTTRENAKRERQQEIGDTKREREKRERERERERERDIQTETERQTDRDRQTERDRQRETETDRQREREVGDTKREREREMGDTKRERESEKEGAFLTPVLGFQHLVSKNTKHLVPECQTNKHKTSKKHSPFPLSSNYKTNPRKNRFKQNNQIPEFEHCQHIN